MSHAQTCVFSRHERMKMEKNKASARKKLGQELDSGLVVMEALWSFSHA